MNIYEQAEKIKDQQDFVEFMKSLIVDYKENVDEWDNGDLAGFLEGLYGYSYDKPQVEVSWKVFAEVLLAASVYE